VDVCPKFLNSIYGSHSPLGVKINNFSLKNKIEDF
jgi:hypothetical protein